MEAKGTTIVWDTNYTGGDDVDNVMSWNDLVVFPTTPTREGYTFTGWYTDTACTVPTTEMNQGYTYGYYAGESTIFSFYAGWTLNPTYSITYDTNGGEGGIVIDHEHEEDYSILVSVIEPTMTNYSFLGWTCNTDENLYQPGDRYTMLAEDVVFTAKWVKKVVTVESNVETVLDESHHDELIDSLFTEEEKSLHLDMEIVLNVTVITEDSMDEVSQTLLNSFIDAQNASLDAQDVIMSQAMILDINMEKILGDSSEQIYNLDEEITITIAIDSSYLADDRTFFIVRNHDGELTLLEDLDDNPNTITIRTDRFSNYALVYTESKDDTVASTPITPTATTSTTTSQATTAPKTGDHTNAGGWIAMMCLSVMMFFWMKKKEVR